MGSRFQVRAVGMAAHAKGSVPLKEASVAAPLPQLRGLSRAGGRAALMAFGFGDASPVT